MKMGFMKSVIKRGQKGLTLVELMVVMSILAVLAAIVFPAVSGTQEVSRGSQVRQDASTVNTSIADYFKDEDGVEVIVPNVSTVLGTATTEKKSERWPEKYTTVGYALEFPETAVTGAVNTINIKDKAGAAITAKDFVEKRQAIDFTALSAGNYIPSVPKSATSTSGTYHNYFWVVKRTSSTQGTDDSRQVEVYRLVKVESAETTENKTLTYEQIY
ncbi:MAG: type II secretion system protein [Chloroflexi bacterium]|nr:type II secretion system protein [Chloroflexota bacterium]